MSQQPPDDWDPGGFDLDQPPAPPHAQYAPRQQRHRHKADDQLVVSILVMLFCCQPLGIVSTIFSAMAMSANGSGDFDTAHRHAKLAKNFNMWAIILGLVYVGAILLFVVLMMAAAAAG